MTEILKYPGDAVLRQNRAVGYLTACLRAGVDCTRKHINSEPYKAVHGYDEIPVNMEAPMEGQRYPYIHVMYRNKLFEPLSIEETRYAEYKNEKGETVTDEFSTYRFEGTYVINIYATTILERETIADCCIGAFGVDPAYLKLMYDNPYINIAPNMHTLASATANESWGTPWDKDVMTAFRQLSFEVVGEFYYRVSEIPEYISKIEIMPGMEGDAR